MKIVTNRAVELIASDGQNAVHAGQPIRTSLLAIERDGSLVVTTDSGHRFMCEVLQSGSMPNCQFEIGDRLLAIPPSQGDPGVVLGRICNYAMVVRPPTVTIEAAHCLKLKCGEGSVEIRADGKVMIRGEDVLVRAKGTKRIRAGTVSIN